MIEIDFPYSLPLARKICENNNLTVMIPLKTDIRFLPHLLKELGLFSSTSEVKRNRLDLWREIQKHDYAKVGRLGLVIIKMKEEE